MTVVYLPLQGRFAKKKDFTADEYELLACESLNPGDFIYTLSRLARMYEFDLYARNGEIRPTQGFAMDYTNSHPWAAFLTTAFVIAAGIASLTSSYEELQEKEQEEAEELTSYEIMLNQLRAKRRRYLLKVPEPTKEELNGYLDEIVNENPELQEKYKTLRIRGKTSLKLVFDKKDKEESVYQKSVSRFFGPLWSAFGISSFVYWIFYAGSGMFSNFGKYGATNLPEFGFGLSLLPGIVYLGVCVYNYYEHKAKQKAGIVELADFDDAREGILLLDECQYRRDYELTKSQLENSFGIKLAQSRNKNAYTELTKPKSTVTNKSKLIGMTWLASLVGSYIGLQFIGTLIVDVVFQAAKIALPAIELVNLIGGVGFFVGAGIYSLHKAHQKSLQLGGNEVAIPQQSPKEILDSRLKDIQTLKNDLMGRQNGNTVIDEKYLAIALPEKITIQNKYHPPGKKSNGDIAKLVLKTLFKVALNAMSGATLLRFFTIKGFATFLPFVAAGFSNPVTLGLIIGFGVAWGLFKLYQEYKEDKANEEKKLQLEEQKINTEYVRNIEMADLQISALQELKKNTKPQVAAASAAEVEKLTPQVIAAPTAEVEKTTPQVIAEPTAEVVETTSPITQTGLGLFDQLSVSTNETRPGIRIPMALG